MSFQIDISNPADLDALSHLEWIETNGTGGWASSTVAGMNTRRYHGLLVASDPLDSARISQISRLDETLISGTDQHELGTNDYGDAVNPSGYRCLTRFSRDLFPEFIYQAGGITLKKTVAAIHGENTTVIQYLVKKSPGKFTLRLSPLISCRDYHALVRSNSAIQKEAQFEKDLWHIIPYQTMPEIFIQAPGFLYTPSASWFYNFHYREEAERGLDCKEDLFAYGYFDKELNEGDQVTITLSSGKASAIPGTDLLVQETKRRMGLVKGVHDELEHTLRLAADQFIICKGDHNNRIIAGYHWFTSWGRDTMIAMTGLCLATGRASEAKLILQEFIRYISEGMLPNRFPERGDTPEYNTADASLWFFVTCYNYMEATGDKDFLIQELLPQFREIMDWHFKGTRYNIHVDEDGLLFQGEEGAQLTWMDARVNGMVITPRTGKAVEINALWYNALKIYSYFLHETGDNVHAVNFQLKAATLKDRFLTLFWNEEGQYLYDVVNGHIKDASLRPNQLLALSLPFALLEGPRAKQVLDLVTEKLYTPYGLRSLSQDDPAYQGHYTGGQDQRDSAYHQGTVWAWLLGPYMDAILKVYGKRARKMVLEVISAFKPHLQEAGIGTVSEIFDGDSPHAPRGCIAQAWSVGELLRVYTTHKLYQPVVKKKLKQTA